mmetsp:Transcript_14208/g.36813  ORF Transcript_14208/g.36813 Transcript_14208/m.36813 type:complete len:350 (+) Transcript_14208:263-1312(+)
MTQGEGAAGFQKEEYENLRRQVCELKLQQKQATKIKTQAKESLAQQQLKHEAEAKHREYEFKIEGLQKQVRDVTERSSKVRGQYEREKTALAAKADKLALRLEQQQKEHRGEVEAMRGKFDEERTQLKGLFGEAEQANARRAAERDAYWREQLDALREQLEGRMLQQHEEHRERVAQLEEDEISWRQSCDELRNARDDVQDELDALREEYQKAQEQVRLLQTAFSASKHEWQEERELLRRRQGELRRQALEAEQRMKDGMMAAEAEWQEKLQQYRDAKAADMDMIHGRMKSVLAKRDAVIKALREELQEARVELSKVQGVMQQRSRELVGLSGSGPSSPWRQSAETAYP